MKQLDKIFNPETIAVIGASDRKGSVGYGLFKNLIGCGFKGAVYPVNIKRESVQSVKAYPSVKDIPDKIDLAIIAAPAAAVPQIVEECGQAGVAGAVIISAGFKEIGEEGEKMCDEIVDAARKHKMRIIGPNCLGFIKPSLHLNASFANKMALPGKLAFISQSGALCTAILDWSVKNNVGFSHFVSVGEMIDVDFHDLIDYFAQDEKTESILIYMESLANARKFLSAARACVRNKPIILLKAGKSEEGAKAAKSHTGGLAGNDIVFNAAFKRAGIIRVDTIIGLFHTAKTLAMQPRPLGNRIAVITNAGGPGVLATDTLIELQGRLADLSQKTLNKLDKCLPPAWSKGNPIDILGDADPGRYGKALEICLDDENTDAVLVILTPQSMTEPAAAAKEIVAVSNRKACLKGKSLKPAKTILASWMGGDDVAEGRKILESGNIPVYRAPEEAVQCFINVYSYSKNLELLYETPATIPHAFKPKTKENKKLIKDVLKQNRFTLTEPEAKKLLDNYGIPVVEHAVAGAPRHAGKIAADIGFPVVMKILSADILHKTDIGGVKLNINSAKEAETAFGEIMSAGRKHFPKAAIQGVFIEKMVKKKYELIIGCKKDPIFGPAIVFGMGGVAVEIFKDINVGLPPLNMSLAMRLIEDTKIYKLLRGYRGMPGVDIGSIQFLLYKFAYLVADFPEIKEIDINPFAVDENGGIVLDAKVILDKKIAEKEIKPYSHLVISPYPKEYIGRFKMKNNKTALLRPIRPEDEPLEAALIKTFSKETQRQRFFGQIKDITHEMLVRYTQIDYDREMAIVAEITEKGEKKFAGVSRLIADSYGETAEFAVAVGDPWHFQGLGKKLTDYILDIAKQRKIKKVCAQFLKDNKIMRHILEKRGFKITEDKAVSRAELELRK
ncbi:MAG: bifunctional acetate--CoA ligase family protein/GNAT family N-acetyltransferase [bacterium]|nr:bifunctional acetate--CoA ligase family protein/GNAT family N-acetyltransferase [bacterium]